MSALAITGIVIAALALLVAGAVAGAYFMRDAWYNDGWNDGLAAGRAERTAPCAPTVRLMPRQIPKGKGAA